MPLFTMGRYAQRRIRGGGPPPSTGTHLASAVLEADTTLILATFSADIDAGDFTTSDFTTDVMGATCLTIGQATSDTLELGWDTDVGAATTLTYNGVETVPVTT